MAAQRPPSEKSGVGGSAGAVRARGGRRGQIHRPGGSPPVLRRGAVRVPGGTRVSIAHSGGPLGSVSVSEFLLSTDRPALQRISPASRDSDLRSRSPSRRCLRPPVTSFSTPRRNGEEEAHIYLQHFSNSVTVHVSIGIDTEANESKPNKSNLQPRTRTHGEEDGEELQ